jgi:hypothetical protein
MGKDKREDKANGGGGSGGTATAEKPEPAAAVDHGEMVTVHLTCADECNWASPVVLGVDFPKRTQPITIGDDGKIVKDAAGEAVKTFQVGRIAKMRRSKYEALLAKIAEPLRINDEGRVVSGVADVDGNAIGHYLGIRLYSEGEGIITSERSRKIAAIERKIADKLEEIDTFTSAPNPSDQDLEMASMIRDQVKSLSRERAKLKG